MHVTDTEIATFRARQLPADALVAFADHLADCDECRQRTAIVSDARDAERALGEVLGFDQDRDPHVPELEIHAFVDGTVDESRRVAIAAHIASCRACAAEVSDLREFIQSSARPTRRRTWTYALAAAAVLVLGAAFGLMMRTPQAVQVAALADIGGEVTLDSRGTLGGTGTLAPEDHDRVQDALANGRLSIPAAIATLSGERGTLRGTSDAVVFRVAGPLGTVVLETQPALRWTPAAGASSYVVTLQNEESGQTTSSPPLTDTSWTPGSALAQGATYTWQVVAKTGASETVAPAPPSPPARFRVTTAADAARLAALPPSHLVRGVAYASAGLLDDAERELAALAAANPGSPVVDGLLQNVQVVFDELK